MEVIGDENAEVNVQHDIQESLKQEGSKPAIRSRVSSPPTRKPAAGVKETENVALPGDEQTEPAWVAAALPQIGTPEKQAERNSWMAEALSSETAAAEKDLAWMKYLPKLRAGGASSKAAQPSWMAAALSKLASDATEEAQCKRARVTPGEAIQKGSSSRTFTLTVMVIAITMLLAAMLAYDVVPKGTVCGLSIVALLFPVALLTVQQLRRWSTREEEKKKA
jgi:hypothetical protein